MGIAVIQHRSGCTGFYVKALIKLGCTREEVDEMLSVSVYIAAGRH